MALSQIQCLDDNHVNLRTTESKPEFLYCEDQRLALEALLRDGREAFVKYLGARGLRGFLSDPELEALTETAEPYDPGSELFLEDAEEDEPPLSQHYWPDLSDTSIPQMDLGWPDSASYRGVTRTAVYTQPPLEGHTHIKEVVRKMIAQAQKVIAVVMDMFTDVDIFRDLLDAGFKRKVSVYILLEHNTLPHFRSMCERADMHAGHLKNLRVRCTDGRDFHTRSCKRVRGRMGHRFMFVDGDKAVSGSYGFTWMASRLDKNLITVVTGQAVDAFDRLFRVLYASSSFVDLRQVATEPEPELEPVPQVATVQASPADIARKLYSPKYALVALSNPSPTPSASPKETQDPEDDPKSPESKKRRRRKANQEAAQEAPPLHPGLIDLEKASLISYLPIWPEPDPPSDVIGFINVRDISKPTQVHLQRSEMFEKSQAIRFSSPVSMPKEILPDVAKPRQFSVNPMEKNKRQPAQDKSKAKESQAAQLNAGVGDIKSKAEAPGQKTPASGPKCDSNKDTMKALNTENKLHSNTPKNQEAGHNTTPQLNAHTPRQSSGKAPTPDTRKPLQTVTTLAGFNTETSLNTHRPVVVRTNTLESSSKHTSHLQRNADTEPHTQTKKVLPDKDSHTQPQKIPTSPTSVSPTSVSEKNHISISKSTTPSSPVSFIPSSPSIPHLISSPTALNPPLPPSSASPSLTSTPPVPKPRTVQLVMTGVIGDSGKLPEFSVVRKSETNTGSLVVLNEPTVAKEGQPSAEKVPETVPDLHNNNGSQTLAQKDSENKEEAPQQNQIGTTQEVKNEEEIGGCDDRAGMLLVAGNNLDAKSDVLITGTLKEESSNIQELIPKDVDVKTLMSVDCKLTPQVDCAATVQTEIKAPEKALPGCEFSEVPNEKTDLSKAHQAPQRISHSELTPQDTDVLDTVDSLIAPTHSPVPSTHVPKDSAGDGTHTSAADTRGQQGYPSITPAPGTDSKPNTAKQNTHGTFQEQTPTARGSTHTPERPLRLQLTEVNVPDLRSPTPEKESWLLGALTRTPTPDGYHSCTPTSDSRTPDFRTPTPDGYFSARTDSALSTNSEEYYECSGSPLNEAVLDRAASRKNGTIEDHVSFTLTNTPNATGITTSPAYINHNSCDATVGATDRNTSSSETQSVSGPAKVSSSSSLPEKKEVEEKENGNEENGRKVDEKGTSLVESRTEGDYQGSERKGSEEVKRTAEHLNQSVDSTETKEINQETQPPKRKKVLNQSAAETPAELTNERTEPKQLSTGDPQPTKATSEVKRPDKEKTVDKAALGPSSVERRDKPQPTREADGQKLLRTPSKSPRAQQQQGSGSSSPSRPARPARPLSANLAPGPLPSGGRQLNQTESKVLHGSFQVLDNASSPRRPPTRPPPPATAGAVGSAAGRKQAEVSRSQQSLLTRQPLSAQGRTRAGQPQNQHSYPKPPTSFLHTHSNREQQLHHHSQNQTAAPREAHWQEEGRTPFSFTFSRLYNLKGLKDRMGKLPSQSKRGSASSPGQGRKSTS
ncbi:mucin-2-like [Centropristis striata]|uniref:mucin-2-like n=1 Tax=Centropristis striata TaxID=184440 RepID=UPI0027E21659|nr:mucin-2-like [Centropristis striata]